MKSILAKPAALAIIVATSFSAATYDAAASILSYKQDLHGVTFKLDKGVMELKVCKDDIIEVKYSTLPAFAAKTSLVVTNEWKTPAKFQVSDHAGHIVISTARLKIDVDKATNAIQCADVKGHVILAEAGAAGKTMTAATVAGIDTYTCSTEFLSPQDEALFGLGCHPEDPMAMNYKGRDQDMAIKYMTGAIPVLLSTRGYGLMWDNYAASKFFGAEDGNTKYKYVSESGTMVDYYFFYGPDFDHIIALYREATGQAPMFPRWAFGLFQSQDRYQSQAEVLSVAQNYRKNQIPVDCIVQDWFYWEPDVIGSHVMYPTRYPDPKAMVDELHNDHLHAMISIWPVFAKGTNDYEGLKNAGGLTSITWDNVMTHTFDNYYDAHSAPARDLYWQQIRDSLIGRYGWDAIWVDQCEPDNGSLLDARRQADFAIGKGIDYFNTYSLMHTTGLYQHWRKDVPGKRAFFLARQAFAGQQRNATTLWSSDITCTFQSFKNQVPQGINACASGIPYWTSDIGGYHLNWKAPDWSAPANRELFTRWFEFGAFCPVFRIHGKGERALFSSNWDADTKAILLKYDNLRYRLMPYLYSLSWKVTHEAYTMMRALSFDFRNDPSVYNIKDQYMFGPAFLVSPVTDQLYTLEAEFPPPKTRKVYLPKSTRWVDFWSGLVLEGGQTINAFAPIEKLPLYVKAGSIVPLGPFEQYAAEKPADPIELRIYPGANGQFTLYEDENDNYDYEKGEYATIKFTWDDGQKTLTISDRKGEFPGMLKERTFSIVVVGRGQGAGVEICPRPLRTVKYNGTMLKVKL
ncbi:MAG: TIM-barrel domain-containing protein [Bacteroidota bacterium]